MRSLVILLTAVGLAVGLLPLMWHVVAQTFFLPDVEYNGVYEPLQGVETSRAYQTALDLSFDVRSNLLFYPAFYVFPFVGAGLGAGTAFVLGRSGFRLTSERE